MVKIMREQITKLEKERDETQAFYEGQSDRAADLQDSLHKREAELAEIKATHARIVAEECAPDEQHCTCVPALRARMAELEAVFAYMQEAWGCATCCWTDADAFKATFASLPQGRWKRGDEPDLIKRATDAEAQLAAMREALEYARTGYVNLLDLRLLPHKGYEADARKTIARIDAALAADARKS
jgi:hypothetical protein